MALPLENIRDLPLEMKSAAAFGLIALVLSFLTGLAAGNNLLYALVKSLVLTAVFAAMGYGVILVLRRFVPEMLDLLGNTGDGMPAEEAPAPPGTAVDAVEPPAGEPTEAEAAAKLASDAQLEKEFEPFKSGDYRSFTSAPVDQNGRMGKHIVAEEKKIKYEPKIIAEAIRTMIHRDDKD